MHNRLILNFEIHEKLGEGGMGVVYSALDRKLNRMVALKFLPPHLSEAKENVDRLVEEAKAISALNHPNIATIYGLEAEGAERFLVLEYLPGGTLKKKLQEAASAGQWLTIGQVLDYAIGASKGLAHAHRCGILHRDVKTSNLMLTDDGTVKLTDFGLAKSTRSQGAARAGVVIGTAAYMAPEQAQGGDIDARSDIFSWGVALFELTSGRLPFEAPDEMTLLSHIIHEPAPRLRAFRADAPERLERVVTKAMERRPEDRYQSMSELLANLQELRGILTAEAHTVTAEIETVRRTTRRKWLAAAGLGVVAAAPAVSPRVRQLYLGWFRPPPVAAEKLVAVLPFRNLGPPMDDALCAGLTEILTNRLTQLEQFQGAMRVVAASDVLSQHVASARDARNAFGAALVLTGSVQREGERLVTAVNLVDTKTQAQLSAHTIEHSVEALARLQDLLLDSVSEMLALEVKPEARRILALGVSEVPAAYSYWVTGRGYLQRYDRIENLDNAITMFQQAVERDTKYALAYAGLAEAYWRKYDATKDPGMLELARTHGLRAIKLNDQLSQAHVTMGLIQTSGSHYGDATGNFKTALALEPLNVDAQRGLARAYEGTHRLKEAEQIYREAVRLRPNSWDSHKDLGRFYFYNDRYSEAVPSFRRVIELTPDNYQAYSNLATTYLKLGRNEDAAAMLERSLAIKPEAYAYSGLGHVYYFQGRYADAAMQFEKAKDLAPKDPLRWGNLADAYHWTPSLANKAPQAYHTAIELAEAVLARNPKDAKLRSNLGMYRSSAGDRSGALREIEGALRMAPADGYVLFRAALVYEQSGIRDRALNAIEACLKAGYSQQEIQNAPPLTDLRKDPRYRSWEKAKAEMVFPGKSH